MRDWANRVRLGNSLVLMVLVGLALRLALIVWLRYYDFPSAYSLLAPPHFHFEFGYETGAVAYSLATGHGFSSPFGGSTGPTAWLAPLTAVQCAAIYRCNTFAGARVKFASNCRDLPRAYLYALAITMSVNSDLQGVS